MNSIKTLTAVAVVVLLAACASADYYHGTDGTVSLAVDSSKALIKFDYLMQGNMQDALIQEIGRIHSLAAYDEVMDDFVVCSLYTGTGYAGFLDSLRQVPGIYLAEPFHVGQSGVPMLAARAFAYGSTRS